MVTVSQSKCGKNTEKNISGCSNLLPLEDKVYSISLQSSSEYTKKKKKKKEKEKKKKS